MLKFMTIMFCRLCLLMSNSWTANFTVMMMMMMMMMMTAQCLRQEFVWSLHQNGYELVKERKRRSSAMLKVMRGLVWFGPVYHRLLFVHATFSHPTNLKMFYTFFVIFVL